MPTMAQTMSLFEALAVLPFRRLSDAERQDRHRHGHIDPRLSDLVVLAASLLRENEGLRRRLRRFDDSVPATTKLRLKPVANPVEADGHDRGG